MTTPTLLIIAGPNGAGKTTTAINFLPEIIGMKNFVNADLIAKGLSPFDPSLADLQATRIMVQKMKELRNDDLFLLTTENTEFTERGILNIFHIQKNDDNLKIFAKKNKIESYVFDSKHYKIIFKHLLKTIGTTHDQQIILSMLSVFNKK
jgi:DNA polymerase III delta prime subunit